MTRDIMLGIEVPDDEEEIINEEPIYIYLNTNAMNINENYKSASTQNAQIAAWLKSGNKLTSLDALNMFQCMRLASRIHDLREKGMDIKSERIVTPSGKRVIQYSLNV